jgi:hypothetical protein
MVVQGNILISTTATDCVCIINQRNPTQSRNLRCAPQFFRRIAIGSRCRWICKTNLRQRDRPNPSQISDLSEEMLCCHWAGIMIYTLALQSVSMPVCTIARLFRWRRIPNPPRYRTLNDALIYADQIRRRCKYSVVVPFRTSLRPHTPSHTLVPPFYDLCAIERS